MCIITLCIKFLLLKFSQCFTIINTGAKTSSYIVVLVLLQDRFIGEELLSAQSVYKNQSLVH
jgi:hypothetical protein